SRRAEFSDLKVGDVISYDNGHELITHRIVAVNPDGSLSAQGDANSQADAYRITAGDAKFVLVETMNWTAPVIAALDSPVGIALIVLLLADIIQFAIIMLLVRRRKGKVAGPLREPTGARDSIKSLGILYFGPSWQPRWNDWDEIAGEIQKMRLKDTAQLAEELEFGLFAYDALAVFSPENADHWKNLETVRRVLAAYTEEKVSEAWLTDDAWQSGTVFRSGKKCVIVVDPTQAEAAALAASALSGPPRNPAARCGTAGMSPAYNLPVWQIGTA
ncbi:MAG: hypothetical protein FWC62_09825, partial [Firmicutes bacterium]|nr:hypothetical protein [Bacillota bacterium]